MKKILFALLLLASCSSPYMRHEVYGADEFVLDSYKIREGKISIQELEGKCPEELDEELLKESLHSGEVALIGSTQSSLLPVDGKTHLYELLSKAGVPSDVNLFKSYVLRESQILPVDLYKLIKEGDMEQNIALHGGDKIYLAGAQEAVCMIMGEVNQQKTLSLPNGFISLRQGLAEAGGVRYTGDKSYIQVIRGGGCKPKLYTLSWEHIIHLPNDSLLLMPGDIVYVAAKPITEWHRFISQLLPSFVFEAN